MDLVWMRDGPPAVDFGINRFHEWPAAAAAPWRGMERRLDEAAPRRPAIQQRNACMDGALVSRSLVDQRGEVQLQKKLRAAHTAPFVGPRQSRGGKLG
jgi:hypothetical protein